MPQDTVNNPNDTSFLAADLDALAQSQRVNAAAYMSAMTNGNPASLLERFPAPTANKTLNPNGVAQTINMETREFTSLCPLTKQPDFATIKIEYVPNEFCVESKALKLYLMSFRDRGEFHEACVNRIANDLVELMKPAYLKVIGEFTPRGGIPIWPTCEYYEPFPTLDMQLDDVPQ